MSSLKDKANALRELAADLDRIDAGIQQIFTTPHAMTATQAFAFQRTGVIPPRVPPLAIGQVIYFDNDPRFIARDGEGVRLLDVDGKECNSARSLEALAKELRPGGVYSLRPRS